MSKRAFSFVLLVFVVVAAWSASTHADTKAGLVGYWPLDGDATDASMNRNDGTIVGNVRPVPDRYNMPNATLLFPGEADSYVDVGNPAVLRLPYQHPPRPRKVSAR